MTRALTSSPEQVSKACLISSPIYLPVRFVNGAYAKYVLCDKRSLSFPPKQHSSSFFFDVVVVGTVQRLIGLRVFFKTLRPLVDAQSVRRANRDRTVSGVALLACSASHTRQKMGRWKQGGENEQGSTFFHGYRNPRLTNTISSHLST